MLTEKEFEQLQKYAEKNELGTGPGKAKVEKILKYIGSKFVIKVPSQHRTDKPYVGQARPDNSPQNETDKRERLLGMKVRTVGESEISDEFRKRV